MMKSSERNKRNHNLTLRLASAVKQCVESRFTDDAIDCESANGVCMVLEAIFISRLREKYFVRTAKENFISPNFWPFIAKFTHPTIKAQICNLSQIKTDFGRSRAWLRLTLNDGLFENYMSSILREPSIVKRFYHSSAYFLDLEEMDIMRSYAASLGKLNFNAPVNSSILNSWTDTPLKIAGYSTDGQVRIVEEDLDEDESDEALEAVSALEFDGLGDQMLQQDLADDSADSVSDRMSTFTTATAVMQPRRLVGGPTFDMINTSNCAQLGVDLSPSSFYIDSPNSSASSVAGAGFSHAKNRASLTCDADTQLDMERFTQILNACNSKENNVNSEETVTSKDDSGLVEETIETIVEVQTLQKDNLESPINNDEPDQKTEETSQNQPETPTPMLSYAGYYGRIGNSLNGMDSWSSGAGAFEAQSGFVGASEAIYSSSPASNAASSSKNVNENSLHDIIVKMMNETIFSKIWSVDQQKGNSADLVKPEENSSGASKAGPSSDADYVLVEKSVTNVEPVEKSFRMKCLTKFSHQTGLGDQEFKCSGCRRQIGLLFGAFRICEFDGRYYCAECHLNEESMIPVRVVTNWDFKPRKVSRASKAFLDYVSDHPVLHLDKLNPSLVNVVSKLNEIREMRRQLCFAAMYLLTCRDTISDDFRKRIYPKEYLYDEVDLYSLSDLKNVTNGLLYKQLKSLLQYTMKHILQACNLCANRGYVCEICRDPHLIFPFQFDSTHRCSKCYAVFHKTCLDNRPCPKCIRRQSYISNDNKAMLIKPTSDSGIDMNSAAFVEI